MRTTILPLLFALAIAQPLSAEQLEPIAPENALATLHVPDDLEVQLIAAEPVIEDPVALAFDTEGRLFVVENRGYPTDASNQGRLSVLQDKDGDGYYESKTIFADGFTFPNGVMPWKGGVLLTSAPTIYFLKDTDGDNVADVREDFLTGFKLGGSTQLYVSHPTLGLDNWLYFTNGLSGGEVIDKMNKDEKKIKMGKSDLRFHPFTRALEATSGRAQFGLTFDNYGHRFVVTNRKHIAQVVIQQKDLARNPYAGLHQVEDEIAGKGSEIHLFALSEATTTAFSHAGTFTAACGLVIYRGSALPETYQENAFTCDPTSNIIHRTVLSGDGPAYKGRRAREGVEFLASTDNWSRPVFTANGPDGALYFCDMYRMSIEHPAYLPKDVIAVTDFSKGKGMGRIYRIAGKGASGGPRSFTADTTDTDALVAQLSAKDSWQRETAQRLLLTEREKTPELIAQLRQLLRNGESEHGRLHSLYLLEGHGALEEADIMVAMGDSHPALREHGIRLARANIGESDVLKAAIIEACKDESSRVRYYAALALGDLGTADVVDSLLDVSRQDLEDSWTRAAVFSGIKNQIAAFATRFLSESDVKQAGLGDWGGPLARMVAQSQPADITGSVLADLLKGPMGQGELILTALEGMAEGLRRNRAYPSSTPALAHLIALAADNTETAGSLSAVLSRSLAQATDSTTPTAQRLHAIRLLGYGSFADDGELLGSLLQPREPREIHYAAVQALGMISDPGVAKLLAGEEAWGLYTTPIRKAALAILLSRSERTAVLLDAMETGAIQAWSIDPITRRRLTSHKDAEIKARAVAIFSNVKKSDRNAVYEDYKTIFVLDADRVAGREVFKNNCAQCHKFVEDGYDVGPDLTGIRSQPRESILLHIIKPNSQVLAGFERFLVETSDFESFSGIFV
ncbi:MAG: HEAT repeat domain-containing protein, partial [Candidatus Hydrogenedentes bacterium]|nr:HEAT repeat domain-containing protein [Candidatus Hydrogenedentota bacterium]